ncbi:MAG: nuclear transport factor 2 family protein [Chthoniobacterales bacterium]
MNSKILLPLLASLLPLSAMAQSSPAPSASATPAASAEKAHIPLPAAPPAPDGAELTKLLKDFLAGASANDAAMHDRFWAEDLVYTGSSGRRVGKAEIMRDVREEAAKPAAPDAETALYTAEDIRIQQYGDTAIVAFRLVGTTTKDGKTETADYLNSGTFLKRAGKWQVVNWQATKKPPADEAKE